MTTIDDATKQRLRKQFDEYIKSKGMRQTHERAIVLERALEQDIHFDVDELYRDIRSTSHVSLATVYNTVDLLCECDILRKHYLQENQASYELAEDQHVHLICTKCGKVTQVRSDEISQYLTGVKFGTFHSRFVSANVYGICADCQGAELVDEPNGVALHVNLNA